MERAPVSYAASPGRYKTRGDAYIVVKTGHQPADAAQEYAADNPTFSGLLIVIGHAQTKPAIGIDRKIAKEYKYAAANGQTRRTTE